MVELGIGTVNLLYIPDGLGKKEGEGREREERRIEDAGAQREAQVQLREDRSGGMGMGEPKDSA